MKTSDIVKKGDKELLTVFNMTVEKLKDNHTQKDLDIIYFYGMELNRRGLI